jgi:hypothetical protein
MKRRKAITCLKEIGRSCKYMSPDAITLLNTSLDGSNSKGYEIHIKTLLDTESRQQVKSIAEKYSLVMHENQDRVIIYQPKLITKQA